jgi:hypothetical protein
VNSLYFSFNIKCIYSLTLRSSELSIPDSSSSSIFDMLGMLNWDKGFLKLKSGDSRSAIEMLRSTSIVLVCFWGIGFYCSFFGCLQSLAKCFGLSQL